MGARSRADAFGLLDEHELDTIFIVTGIALDASEETGMVDLTLQSQNEIG
jgi:hypothetical protein